MSKYAEPKVLFAQDGLRVTTKGVTTLAAEYSFADIQSAGRRITKPVLGPVLLALLGTLNLTVALETRFWLDILASSVMLGFGLFWWILGTRYILTLKVRNEDEDVDAWASRHEKPLSLVLEVIREQLARRC